MSKERPILFSAPMVRAILAGTKTQTRRALRPQPTNLAGPNFDGLWSDTIDPVTRYFACLYGKPGDRLWVRETWQLWEHRDYFTDEADIITHSLKPFGKPDDEATAREWRSQVVYSADIQNGEGPWRPSIFMPRWARITLEIVSVRVERLQEISPEDAIAEGIRVEKGAGMIDGEDCYMMTTNIGYMRGPMGAIEAYKDLWESINGEGSWTLNPWVWVVEFRRVES